MTTFYIPGARVSSDWPFIHAFDAGEHPACREVFKHTPDNRAGFIYSWHDGLEIRPGMEWRQSEGYWISTPAEKPRFYARAKQMPGHPVKMADGQVWMIPPVRMLGGSPSPNMQRIDFIDGEWRLDAVEAAYSDLFERCCEIYEQLKETGTTTLTDHEVLSLAAKALTINYRLGFHEIAQLRLLSPACYLDVIKAMVDLPSAEKILKKKAHAESSGSPGSED